MTSRSHTAVEPESTRATDDAAAGPRTMRAVRYHEFGGADVLDVDEVSRPTPDRDEVLVEMRAASVNRVDVMFRTGEYGQVPLPSVPGGDGAGVVAAVGEAVDRFEPGERVVASGMDRAAGGTFAEYAAVPETKLAALPADVPFDTAAALANVGVAAWLALEELAGVQAGDRVLVHGGSGGVGHAELIFANAPSDCQSTETAIRYTAVVYNSICTTSI